MKIRRVLAIAAGVLVVGLALAGPAGAGSGRPNGGTEGPARIDADGFALTFLDEAEQVGPPPSTNLPPLDDPFDLPPAPGAQWKPTQLTVTTTERRSL